MPQTAVEMGLSDPFDPLQAIPASARFLRKLYNQFGNLGLAAAAYNAGGGRIEKWLSRRSSLPAETRAYVKISITGHQAEAWTDEESIVYMPTDTAAESAVRGRRWPVAARPDRRRECRPRRLPPARCCARRRLKRPKTRRTRPRRSCAWRQVRRPYVIVLYLERRMPVLRCWQERDRRASRGNKPPYVSRQLLLTLAARSHRGPGNCSDRYRSAKRHRRNPALTPPDTSSPAATDRCPSPRCARPACRRARRPGSGRGWAGCNCLIRRGR